MSRNGHPSNRATVPILAVVFAGLALGASVACGRLNRIEPASTSVEHRAIERAVEAGGALRIATYNVHMESAFAIVQAIQTNEELARADVLLFQEIESHLHESASRAEQVANALDMSMTYAPGYGLRSGGSHGVAILSRYPLEDVELIELPYHHVVVNSARRVALAATIRLDGQDVRIISVHLDNRINPSDRRRQLAPVLEAAEKFSGPLVIAGDLNTSPFCWLGNLVPVPCGLQDDAVESAARSIGMDTPMTTVGSTSKWLGMRLDAIYTRGLVAMERGVERSVKLSDHKPLWVDVQLPSRVASAR